jgi:hypothetical protein
MRYNGFVAKIVLSGSVFEYVFAGQKHALAPSSDNIPAGHATHALDPVTFENVPAGHMRHALTLFAPVATEYAPAGQRMHVVTLVAAVSMEYVPPAHAIHALEPLTVLYCPGGHAEHCPPFGPVYPASHAQLLRDPLPGPAREFRAHKLQFGLPSGDHCPSGHARQVSLLTAPKFTEKSPIEQFEHAVRPS